MHYTVTQYDASLNAYLAHVKQQRLEHWDGTPDTSYDNDARTEQLTCTSMPVAKTVLPSLDAATARMSALC